MGTARCCVSENMQGGREGEEEKGKKEGNASSDLSSQESCKAGIFMPILQMRNQSQR